MVRAYGMKGHKRRRRKEKYDDNEEEGRNKKVQVHEIGELPIVPSVQKTRKPGAIFVLENACLEVAKIGKSYQILNADDHANFLRRNKKKVKKYRPDIVHQALLSILDSPLNKAERVRAVYVKTDKGVLFQVNPLVHLPRTYKGFAGLMLQLLQQLSITATNGHGKILRVIKNPVTQYLPLNSHKIGFSYSSEKLVEMDEYVPMVGDDCDFVFVVGAMAHGKINCDFVDDSVAVSSRRLSAAWSIALICTAVAKKWGVL